MSKYETYRKYNFEYVKLKTLKLKYNHGTIERFQEFIAYILNSNMNSDIFSLNKTVDVAHVAPFIGIMNRYLLNITSPF